MLPRHQVLDLKDTSPSVITGAMLAGKYRVEHVLGEGGMGIVVAATNEALRQRVAIKLLRSGTLANANALGRFEREARRGTRRRDHPSRPRAEEPLSLAHRRRPAAREGSLFRHLRDGGCRRGHVTHANERDHRVVELYVPGAAPVIEGRRAHRHLGARRDPLRAAHEKAALSSIDGHGARRGGADGARSGSGRRPARRAPSAHRRHPSVPREEAAAVRRPT